MIDSNKLKQMSKEIDETLEKETEESLKEWLSSKRKKEWKRPKLISLDKKLTMGGRDHGGFYEDTMYIPGKGGMGS